MCVFLNMCVLSLSMCVFLDMTASDSRAALSPILMSIAASYFFFESDPFF